jgi:hypothetical protein
MTELKAAVQAIMPGTVSDALKLLLENGKIRFHAFSPHIPQVPRGSF